MKKVLLVVISLSVLVVGCGNNGQPEEKNQPTQVVAKVNGKEISIHQVNALLANANNLDQSKLKLASEQALRQLVDLEIIKQKSIDEKLDRDPKVLRQIEQAKQQILAQAYINKLYSKKSAPTETDVSEFYTKHPELFSDRKIYQLLEYVITAKADKHAEIESAIKGFSTLDEVAMWLKEHRYSYAQNANEKPAEQIPTEILKQLYPLKDGDNLLVKTPSSVNMVHIMKTISQPVELEKASPVIKQYIVNSSRAELVKAEVGALRNAAKVEYLGEFSKMKNDPSTLESKLTSQVVN